MIGHLVKVKNKIDDLMLVVTETREEIKDLKYLKEIREEIKDLKEIKEDKKSHKFLTVSIF